MPETELFLIDAYGLIFRAYHARARSGAPPMRTRSGQSTEAVYIFHNMLRRLLNRWNPTHLAAVFEGEGPSLREEQFAAYKANRPEAPADLKEQIPYVIRMLEAMRIPVLSQPGYEADDLIGSLARQAESQGWRVTIVSSDKDLMQLVSPQVRLLNPMKDDALYGPEQVREFLGVPPERVADLLALKGDAVDNIPGAPGIGDKGALALIQQFGGVESVLEHAEEVSRKAYRESLKENRNLILLSKQLATIDTRAPIPWNAAEFERREPDYEALREICKELEFHSLLRELEEKPALASASREDFRMLQDGELAEWLRTVPAGAPLAFVLFQPGGASLTPPELGVSIGKGQAVRVVLDAAGPLLERLATGAAPCITHDYKTALKELAPRGVRLAGEVEDVMLYAFLLEADPGGCSLERLASHYLDRKLSADPALAAETVYCLADRLRPELEGRGLRQLYAQIDRPLIDVLFKMEQNGVCVDTVALEKLSERMEREITRLTAEIHALAGRSFNINSPQQLGKVLFEELKLPAQGRTGKTGSYTTSAEALEALASEHPIAAKVLEYRQLVKLKGTYVDALPALIDPRTGRIHTTFNQTGAATGRLSSINPNLQNIPVRTELGREIRAAFIASQGWRLLAADYSQIELRLLAHFSRDPVLLEAFRNGEDIHTRTAAEVFGVPPLMVTPEMRRNAKAVNFGIVYGQTPFGLAAQLGISREEAEKYIRGYFERYAGVKKWIEATIEAARRAGKTRTLFGRERPIPDIHSKNANARNFAERTAVNTPLQGTAADLIKLAMIRIDAQLERENWKSRLLLQVHDELLFEAPPEEVEALSAMVKREMEQVHRLEVPLLVEVGVGANWRDAK